MARNAAAREGISVGDWLTRRIYTESHPGSLDPPIEPVPQAYRYARDNETRRDHEELVHCLARAEAETEAAFRRIDETLRGLGRRLETAERSQNEAKIAIHTAASEINAATREQAQTFNHLSRRVDDVERGSDTGALRDAVRALHQGMSRLADQTAKTATDSSTQINSLANSLDNVSKKVVASRAETSRLGEDLVKRINDLTERLAQADRRAGVAAQRATNAEQRAVAAQEQAVAAHEQAVTAQEHANAMAERAAAIEERAAGAEFRASQAEDRAAGAEERAAGVDERLSGFEERIQETMGHHFTAIERNFEIVSERLERSEMNQGGSGGVFEETILELRSRLEAAEKHSREALAEFRSSLDSMARRLDSMELAPPTRGIAGYDPHAVSAGPVPVPPLDDEDDDFDLPPFPEMPGARTTSHQDDLPAMLDDEYPGTAHDDLDDIPPPPLADDDDPLGVADETIEIPAAARDFLSAARRAAQAAAEAEPPRKSRLTFPGIGGTREATPKGDRRRLPLVAIAAVMLVIVGAGALIFRGGFGPDATPAGASRVSANPPASVGPNFTVLPPVQGPQANGAATPASPLTTMPGPSSPAPANNSAAGQIASLGQPGSQPAAQGSTATTTAPAAASTQSIPAQASPAPGPAATEAAAPPPAPPRPVAADSAPAATPAAPAGGGPQAAPSNQVASISGPTQGRPVSGPALSAPQAAGSNAPSPMDRLLSAARGGSPAAALLLGLRYLDGDGVAASDSEAVRWLRRAAEQGEPVAQYRLGSLYERGRGVPADASQVAFWYEQAARSGNRKAMHNLAVAYADGSGVERNLSEAARWFRSAADLGLTDSQFNLAVLYERGMGVPASLSEAYKWYSVASAQGDTEARSRVEVLATQLPQDQRANAERAATSFNAQPLDQAANEPPTLAQIQ
jgi:localization factor PodJL